MPSKIEHEFRKLRGVLIGTNKVYEDTIADIKDELSSTIIKVVNLESSMKSQTRSVKETDIDAEQALNTARSALKKSGDIMHGEIDMNGHDITGISDFEAYNSSGIGFYNELSALTMVIDSDGNIVPQGTIDGRDIDTDGTKLDTIETSATADQTGTEIKTAYEAEADTNAYPDASVTKLAGIESAATGDQTATEIKDLIELRKKYVIGDTVLHSNSTMQYNNAGTYTKLKEISIVGLHPTPVTLRISFDYWSHTGTQIHVVVYKNGGIFGTPKNTTSQSVQNFTEDLSFAEGDLIQIYGYTADPGGAPRVYTRNLYIKGTIPYKTLQEAITDSHVGLATPFNGTNQDP